jgi:hypothetical protein
MRAAFVVCCALAAAGSVARAQIIETPVPFDSARRVVVMTPTLAERLHLSSPPWPVAGEYRDARLYSMSNGGFVLVASLPTGALQRYELTDAQRRALASAIDDAILVSGRPNALGSEPSEPAGNSYARHITVLGALLYAPLAASLFVDEESTGAAAGAAYVLTAGSAFFVSYAAAQSHQFTRAQGDLSANLGVAAGAAAMGIGWATTGNADKGVRAASLGSAIVGTIAGAGLARHMTDAEAHAATVGIEGTAASVWAISAGAGATGRGMAGIVAASAPIGYVLGVGYPRVASYTVTAGDLNAMQTAGLVGGMVGAAVVNSGPHPSRRQLGVAVGAAYVGGLLVGDLTMARPFDLTTSDANLVTVGAFAGGIIGLVVPLVASSGNGSLAFGSAAGGASLGMAAIMSVANIRRAGAPELPRVGSASQLQLSPGLAALGLMTRTPGRYPVLSFSF